MKMNGKNQQLRVNGKKVFLRYVTHEDFEEMQAIYTDSREFFQGLINAPDDKEKFSAYVDRNLNETDECFVICRKSDNCIVGAVNLSQIFRKAFQNAYLGYYLGVKFTGNGFMSEAVELMLRHAFKTLKLHRIEANVQPENIASIAVLKRCGFKKEGFSEKYLKISGRWRDHERWAIVRENWSKRK